MTKKETFNKRIEYPAAWQAIMLRIAKETDTDVMKIIKTAIYNDVISKQPKATRGDIKTICKQMGKKGV
jgi:hypothetical protein